MGCKPTIYIQKSQLNLPKCLIFLRVSSLAYYLETLATPLDVWNPENILTSNPHLFLKSTQSGLFSECMNKEDTKYFK